MEAPSGTTSATSTNEAAAASPGAKKVAHLRADALKLPRGSRTALFVKPRTTRFKIVAGSLYWISKAKKQHNAKVRARSSSFIPSACLSRLLRRHMPLQRCTRRSFRPFLGCAAGMSLYISLRSN